MENAVTWWIRKGSGNRLLGTLKQHMRLPDFLIIGAMKSGTTGLFFDLASHPRVFLPEDKEPHALCNEAVLSDEGQRQYAKFYAGASSDQLIGDASTGYTKLPDRSGVVERALTVLPKDFRAIYIVRDPIARIISQHYHEYSRGMVGPDINTAVRDYPRYVQFSRYAWQLQPWLEAIGRQRIHIIYFEHYKSDRRNTVQTACEFLGLDSAELPEINPSEVFNAGDGKPVPGAIWKRIRENTLYKKLIRPLVSSRARHHLRSYFLRKAPERPPAPSRTTVDWLREQLAEDRTAFETFAGEAPW